MNRIDKGRTTSPLLFSCNGFKRTRTISFMRRSVSYSILFILSILSRFPRLTLDRLSDNQLACLSLNRGE